MTFESHLKSLREREATAGVWGRGHLDLFLANRVQLIEDLIRAAREGVAALDAEIEQHEAFFLQTPSTNGEWDAIHRNGIVGARERLTRMRDSIRALDASIEKEQDR